MIGNSTCGSGFHGLLQYALGKPDAEIVGGNMVGTTARELGPQFAAGRQLNLRVKRPVWHVSLSLPPQDGRLPGEVWANIAVRYLKAMGFANNQYVAIRHWDTPHDHVHIIANRVNLATFKAVNCWQDAVRSQKILRQIEWDYRLTRVADSAKVGRRAPTRDECAMHARLRTQSYRKTLQAKIDAARRGKPTVAVFLRRLNQHGVHVKVNTARNGRVSGISYRYENRTVKGSALGKRYAWQGVAATVFYNAYRDWQVIRSVYAGQHPTAEAQERACLAVMDTVNPSAGYLREYLPQKTINPGYARTATPDPGLALRQLASQVRQKSVKEEEEGKEREEEGTRQKSRGLCR